MEKSAIVVNIRLYLRYTSRTLYNFVQVPSQQQADSSAGVRREEKSDARQLPMHEKTSFAHVGVLASVRMFVDCALLRGSSGRNAARQSYAPAYPSA